MIHVLTPEEMRGADAEAIASIGEDTLMRAAGSRVAERLRAIAKPGARVVAFAGPGNNGGDAFAALAQLGCEYECIVAAATAAHPSQARMAAEKRARDAGVEIRALPDDERDARDALEGAVAVDGIFGTGARLPLPKEYRHLARVLDARERPVVAIDIPSGIDALTGDVGGEAVRATVTVTLAAAKPGLLLEPAREHVGELWCGDIGISNAVLSGHGREYAALDDAAFVAMLPRRASDTDKRGAGAPLIIAGSAQFPGAAVLCALGAARAGAGYVTVATPSAAAPTLRAHLVEQVVVALDDRATPKAVAEELLEISKHNGSVAIGPGLGLDARTSKIFALFLERNELPIVIDASGLFHLAKRFDLLRGKKCAVTPHASEFARLSGRGTVAPGTRVARIREFVNRTGITTLLKGTDTLVYDGHTIDINTTGTSTLATAGTGDVLTGIIATLLAQGLSPYDAARAGAYWHGLAGHVAAKRRKVGVIAGDVIDALADAVPIPPPPHATSVRVF